MLGPWDNTPLIMMGYGRTKGEQSLGCLLYLIFVLGIVALVVLSI